MMRALAITGPTASGKTALSLAVAERIPSEIISCDSMQIYRGMDIGTAKATSEEREAVRHHLIDFLSPTDSYSVEAYRTDALAAVRDVVNRGKLPIFVGGTGLYVDSLMRGSADEAPGGDEEYRERLLSGIKSEEDKTALWERLCEVDPESAEKTHKNNVKRVIRALEIFDKTGVPKSEHDKRTRLIAPEVDIKMITIDFHQRENLYSRVDERVDIMMADGLFDEVCSLYSAGLLPSEATSAQAIGYKEIISHLRGECSLAEAVEEIKLASRRYAKRQLTWFRHKEAVRIYRDSEDGVMKKAEDFVNEALDVAMNLLKI